jgi:hypothetical protein
MTRYLTRISWALAAVALSLAPPLAGQSNPTTPQAIVGEVTDTMCSPSKSHSGMKSQVST